MGTITIDGQEVIEKEKHLVVRLRQPFWSAWKKYGWEKNIEGLGVSSKIVRLALKLKKKIGVQDGNYGWYEKSPLKIAEEVEQYQSIMSVRGGTILWITPRSTWKKVK